MTRRIDIMREKWDHLIVLDGCRYDFFSEAYRSYFEGDLERVVSPGSNTVEWRDGSFPGRYEDVVYVSANPYINSRVAVRDFCAGDHFHDVVDVWEWGWDERLGTVHPGTVNRAALEAVEGHQGKRLIVHYLQPHCPYIGRQPAGTGYPRQEPSVRVVLDGVAGLEERPSVRRRFLDLVEALSYAPWVKRSGLLNESRIWGVRELLGLPPCSPMDALRRERGVVGLREAYSGNLELVLRFAADLVRALDGVVVITSDHGELLGEEGRFSHGRGRSERLLLEVPWFRVAR
jgi:hypothetical protein